MSGDGGHGIWQPEWFTGELLAFLRDAKSPLVICYDLPLLFEISDIRQAIDSGMVKFNTSKSKIKTTDSDGEVQSNSAFITFANFPNIMILDSVGAGKSITFVDIQNYADRDIENTAMHAFRQNAVETIIDKDGNLVTGNGRSMLKFIEEYMSAYVRVCNEYGFGGLRVSAGSQSMQSLRMSMDGYVVTKSNDQSIEEIERKAYHGGRVYACGTGTYNGECHYVDIQSMYPYIGSNYKLPCGLPSMVSNPSVERLRELVEDHYVIASCYVETNDPVYPFCESTQTVYPVGRFESVLHQAEILDAIDANRVKHCRYAICYKQDYWLRDYCTKMIAARKKAREGNKYLDESIIKRITNSIFGKLAQRGNAWVRAPDRVHDEPYGVWWEINPATREHTLCRSIDFAVERRVRNVVIHDTYFPAAGGITAYGRMLLNKYHKIAGNGNVLYACVDGMIVTKRGIQNLMMIPGLFGDKPGCMRVDCSADTCTVFRPGWYVIGSKAINTGYRRKERTVHSTLANIGGKQPEHWERDGELVFRTLSRLVRQERAITAEDIHNLPWVWTPHCEVVRDWIPDPGLFDH
jgi:hypothetical protein